MGLVLRRWLVSLLFMSLLAMVGGLIGLRLEAPVLGTWAGAVCGLLLAGVRDARRAGRLVAWLRGNLEGDAPRDGELWGEMAYRTERALRLREQALKAERQRLGEFLRAIEASPNGVILLDADEQIIWLNQNGAVHLGLDPQRDLGQRITNLVRSPAFVTGLQAGESHEAISLPNYQSRLSLSLLVRVYGDGQRLLLTQDVTERLQADAMRRDFVANVSHEIRTPLTVLVGFVETLASLPLSEAERQRVLGMMGQQTHRMQTLVADLLTLAQLEGSPQPSADQWVSTRDLLAQVEVETRGLSRGRHLIQFPDADNLHAQGADIAGIHSELLSALTNLTSNAVRYTPEGGCVAVSWRLRPSGGGTFEVRDSGIGIAREHLPRLTERFYRVDGSRSRETGGTGLGLSIVKHVAQRHGAALELDSEPGKGSVFRITFPASRVRVLSGREPKVTGADTPA
ncbi:phosphate regulon sensor histidine kinase PhoR [Sphaerotilus sp.]|uniref:phosphate regulon sensor histidine kinase PhoR n=1 Tax=Sphaerotilus sp. TaxID=2093942 RepID=UPI002ACDC029|nr:phosphate regulon sensor histidine kinase PhoR [Sphaerotilus sp.]MDZ7855518.1 phosphate regulon sensor histidine kinase PhoR [Sphaerotilus sp.]